MNSSAAAWFRAVYSKAHLHSKISEDKNQKIIFKACCTLEVCWRKIKIAGQISKKSILPLIFAS